MSEVKSLRAADLGYVWDPRLPDGATWTREKSGTRYLSRKVPELFNDGWMSRGEWVSEFSIALKLLSVEPPGFGDLPWQQCILIKGQEPPEPKYRPYTDEEMKQLVRFAAYIERKDGTCGAIAVSWVRTSPGGPLAVRIGHGGLWTADSLLEEFVLRDGSPCGVEVTDG